MKHLSSVLSLVLFACSVVGSDCVSLNPDSSRTYLIRVVDLLIAHNKIKERLIYQRIPYAAELEYLENN